MRQGRLLTVDRARRINVNQDAVDLLTELGLRLDPDQRRPRFILSRTVRLAFRSPRKLPTREWAERYFPVIDGPMQGRWRHSNQPSAVGIMDAWDFPSVQLVVNVAGVQQSKSLLKQLFVAASMDQDPGSTLLGFPDEKSAQEEIKERIIPLFEASRRLARYKTGRVEDIRTGGIKLRNMNIYLAWSGSPQTWGAKAIRYFYADEVDNYKAAAGQLSSPVSLGLDRQKTVQYGRKAYISSSPSIESGSIWTLASEAQVTFRYHVFCPTCGAAQCMHFGDYDNLEGKRLRWPKGADWRDVKHKNLAWYECEHCGARWDDAVKRRIIQAGEWRCSRTGLVLHEYLRIHRPFSVAFWSPAYNAPYVTFSDIAAVFLRAMSFEGETRNIELRRFFNNYEALPSRIYRPRRKIEEILRLRDDRPRGALPDEGKVACLVAGVDTQDNGFWWRVRAFGYGESLTSWGVDEGFAPDLEAIERILFESEWRTRSGAAIPVRLACIDAMGHRTEEVYTWTRKHRGRTQACQGMDAARFTGVPLRWSNIEYYPRSKRPIPGGLKLCQVSGRHFKDSLYSRFAIDVGYPGAINLHSETSDEYAKHMSAEFFDEQLQRWVCPKGVANHLWDSELLCYVAADILRIKQMPDPAVKKASSRRTESESDQGRVLSRIKSPYGRR